MQSDVDAHAAAVPVPQIQLIVTPPLPSREDLPEEMRRTLDAILKPRGSPVAGHSQSSDSVAGDGSHGTEYHSFESGSPSEPRCAHEEGQTCEACIKLHATSAHYAQTRRHTPEPDHDLQAERVAVDSQVVLRRARHVGKTDPARRYGRYFAGDEISLLLAAQAQSVAASSIRPGKAWRHRGFPGLGILGNMTRTIFGLTRH